MKRYSGIVYEPVIGLDGDPFDQIVGMNFTKTPNTIGECLTVNTFEVGRKYRYFDQSIGDEVVSELIAIEAFANEMYSESELNFKVGDLEEVKVNMNRRIIALYSKSR